ncbi:UNVERIFIED_CONTAM: 8-hydroxygeraniol dehydrogenase [Sesamum latifolium]|uniref:8-hydroxygeraniol dehydrogenase n=1 Tax=Sesamum latifolium TaxID=2727402 RepID=A0AAW2YC96_9LAMI
MIATSHPVKALGWAANDPSGVLAPLKFSRRATGEHDVQFRVLYCGICHSDLHLAKNEWGGTIYPLIPGHEIVGEVTEIGSKVTKVKIGDKIISINSRYYDGTVTYGGFSNLMVADEYFILRWPDNLPLNCAPLLCAGITTYSPLKRFGLDKPGVNVGVVGLGGIGHLTVKFAKTLGTQVTVISTSANKKKEAIETFGADEFLVIHDQDQMQAAASTLDGIIDTASANHSLLPLINLLKPHGKLILIGAPQKLEVPVFPLLQGGKFIVGTACGGIKETQDMLEFAAEHKIQPDIEVIPIDYVNTAMERLEKGDVKYRFVIDVGNSLKAE